MPRVVRAQLREMYFGRQFFKQESEFAKDDTYVDVVVHVRRGDIMESGLEDRVLPISYYRSIMESIRSVRPHSEFTILSEGRIDEFKDLQGSDVSFYLNQPTAKSYHKMVLARVLVLSKSSFSYSAALLNTGCKIYRPFWHPVYSKELDWITVTSTPMDNIQQLRRCLAFV